jgi:hypothetical protein
VHSDNKGTLISLQDIVSSIESDRTDRNLLKSLNSFLVTLYKIMYKFRPFWHSHCRCEDGKERERLKIAL